MVVRLHPTVIYQYIDCIDHKTFFRSLQQFTDFYKELTGFYINVIIYNKYIIQERRPYCMCFDPILYVICYCVQKII